MNRRVRTRRRSSFEVQVEKVAKRAVRRSELDLPELDETTRKWMLSEFLRRKHGFPTAERACRLLALRSFRF
jgi:hypothetical protein